MSPKTDRPRLATLNPDAIAADCDERLEKHLAALAFIGGAGLHVHIQRHGESDLALTLRALTVYAQRGLPVWDWSSHGEARDAVQKVVCRLYGRPSDALKAESDDVGPLSEIEGDLEGDDPIDLVTVAAWARVQIASGEPVTVRQLATLAGLDPSIVRRLAKDGELRLSEGRPAVAKAKEAKRWLGARGVKGL